MTDVERLRAGHAGPVGGTSDKDRTGDTAARAAAARRPTHHGRGSLDRLRFWRSPADQPGWARPYLLGIAAVAAVLFAWNIRTSGYAAYSSTSVKSMSLSWRAFWYGALDPEATVTLDKLAGSFLPQSLSARLFGFHEWSLTLPQVIEGVVSVLVMYRIGRRWHGPRAGLLTAALFTTTPVVASMFGHPMEDGLLVMLLVLAADAAMVAVMRASVGWLIVAGVFIGLGFQAKMMQAWMALPALAITYLVVAPTTLGRRIGHLAAAGAVMLATSGLWVALYLLTPAEHRPYIDSSTNDNPLAMAFGTYGLERLGIHVPGTVDVVVNASNESDRLPTGAQTWTKLVGVRFAGQIGWLYPIVLIGLALGLYWYRRTARTDIRRGGFLLFGLWLATYAAVFSVAVVPHTAYLASMAPAIAPMAAVGMLLAWRAYRDGGPARWVLPVMILAEGCWTLWIATSSPRFLPGLVWTAAIAAALSAVALAVGATASKRSAVIPAAAAVGMLTMVAVPAAWAVSVLDRGHNGSAFEAMAGPPPKNPTFSAQFFGGLQHGADRLDDQQRHLYEYLHARQGTARYLVATDSWVTAGPYILAKAAPVLPMGGFSGLVPQPDPAAAQRMVARGELRFFLLTPYSLSEQGISGQRAGAPLFAIGTWVKTTCRVVPETEYAGGQVPTGWGPPGFLALFDCAAGRPTG